MRKPAMLLIGPTGSGKTPLGNYISEHGLDPNRYAHFDFGELLRQTAQKKWNCDMSDTELTLLDKILSSGALLEKDTFYLAENIISHFNRTVSAEALVLNGLPRHIEQAHAVAPYFDIQTVIHLRCEADTVLKRIQDNSGKDRTGRTDDALELVRQKLRIFSDRTAPLLSFFKNNGAQIIDVTVNTHTQPEAIYMKIKHSLNLF